MIGDNYLIAILIALILQIKMKHLSVVSFWLAGNFGDQLTTIYGLSKGHVEMNLLFQYADINIYQLFVIKWTVVLILAVLTQLDWRNCYFYKVVKLSSYLVWLAVIWNLYHIFIVGA